MLRKNYPPRSKAEREAAESANYERLAARNAAYDQGFIERTAARREADLVPRMQLVSALKHCLPTHAQRRYRLKSLQREILLKLHTYRQLKADLENENPA